MGEKIFRRLPTQQYIFVVAAALLSVALFLGLAAASGGLGFPLDDAWIHQTYARNLVENGRWEYTPGTVSAGSTAPLWTLLLAIGYLLRLPYLWWAYLLGALSLLWMAWGGMRLWRCLWPQQAERDWLVGLVLVLTWPFVWAAVSGMETLLFAAIGVNILARYSQDDKRPSAYARLGILGGLLILTRPDGLVLLLLVVLGLALKPGSVVTRAKAISIFGIAAVVPLIPYFAFNLATSGNVWPNTFYAKQAEYAIALAQPFPFRLSQLLFFSLGGSQTGWRGISGAHLLLLPGLVIAAWQALKMDWDTRRLYHLLPLSWALGHICLYAWRLPVTYQHGRYLWAAIPVWILYGMAGWRLLLAYRFGSRRVMRMSRLFARFTFASLLLIFLFLGATEAYANDVAFIEGEMVNVAHWLAQNTPQNALIAAHDIGAIGYFGQRPLLDLAGLISPEIIPFLANEEALASHILSSEADYLVTAPGWPYRTITAAGKATFVYSTGYSWTQESGSNNMAVYRLN